MRKYSLLIAMLLTLALSLPAAVQAQVVGRVTQVEGRVDLLKGGKLPATPAKVDESVQTGDVLRTKSLSRAQLTFMDSTVITVAPESRLAIEEYLFEPAKSKRSAVLQLFQGLAHVVVAKILQVEQPDFIIKTHTAVLGVRGTELGVRLAPNSSTILNFKGITRVANIFPEVGNLRFKRAQKVAFSFPPAAVDCYDMEGTTVFAGLPPTMKVKLTIEDQKQFMGLMVTGLTSRKGGRDSGTRAAAQASSGTGSGTSGSASATGTSTGDSAATGGGGGVDATSFSTLASDTPLLSDTGTGAGTSTATAAYTVVNSTTAPTGTGGVTPPPPVINIPPEPTPTDTGGTTPPPVIPPVEPPVEPPPPPPPSPATYTFSSSGYNAWTSTYVSSTQRNLTSSGWGVRTWNSTDSTLLSWLGGSNQTYYTSMTSPDPTTPTTRTVYKGLQFGSGTSYGTTQVSTWGTVTGTPGVTPLTGLAYSTGVDSWGNNIYFSGNVTIDTKGIMTFTYADGDLKSYQRWVKGAGTTISVPGTYFTQTMNGMTANTSSSPFNAQSILGIYWARGSRTGVLPGDFSVNLAGGLPGGYMETSSWNYAYLPWEYGDLYAASMDGVVSSMDIGGNPLAGYLKGAMTIWPSNNYWGDYYYQNNNLYWLQPALFYDAYFNLFKFKNFSDPLLVASVSINTSAPDYGRLFGTVYGNNLRGGSYTNMLINFDQRPGAAPASAPTADYAFSQTYNGTISLNSISGSTTQLTTGAMGWGQRTGTYYQPGTSTPLSGAPAPLDGYFALMSPGGTWTLEGGGYLPAANNYPVTAVTQMSGRVTGTIGQSMTGPMTFAGSLLGGTSFSYSGQATLDNGGWLNFNYGGPYGSATWTSLSGSGTATGGIDQNPGYYIKNTYSVPYTLRAPPFSNPLVTLGGPFTGALDILDSSGSVLYPPTSNLSLTVEGVVGNTELGAARWGASTVSLTGLFSNPLNLLGVPTSLTPGGSTFLMPYGVIAQPLGVPNPIQVNTYVGLTTLPAWTLYGTYNGFRLATSTTPFTLSFGEGYGWGLRSGSTTISIPSGGTQTITTLPTGFNPLAGANPLPSSYLSPYVAQTLSTAATTQPPLGTNWYSVTGTLAGNFTGASGGTLTGQMYFSGSNSGGVNFNYNGPATLTADGKLLFYYMGNWTSLDGSQTGTSSGQMYQLPGTYFTQTTTAPGTYLQTNTTNPPGSTGTLYINNLQDVTNFSGTRTEYRVSPVYPDSGATGAITSNFTGSVATSRVNTGPNSLPGGTGGSGSVSVNLQGVVAGGGDWVDRFGVASATATFTPAGGSPNTVTMNGPVVLETNNALLGQFVNQASPTSSATINLKTADPTSGVVTSSFVKTASGSYSQTATDAGSGAGSGYTLTAPTLTGTATGAVLNPSSPSTAVPVNTNLTITSSAVLPGTYISASAPITVNSVGVVGGSPGGAMSGLSSTTVVKSNNPLPQIYVGGATVVPATATTPTTVTTSLGGINLPPLGTPNAGVSATQTGVLATTKP